MGRASRAYAHRICMREDFPRFFAGNVCARQRTEGRPITTKRLPKDAASVPIKVSPQIERKGQLSSQDVPSNPVAQKKNKTQKRAGLPPGVPIAFVPVGPEKEEEKHAAKKKRINISNINPLSKHSITFASANLNRTVPVRRRTPPLPPAPLFRPSIPDLSRKDNFGFAVRRKERDWRVEEAVQEARFGGG
ncbi:hypothetical protein GWI33_005452 [Rhynchophorus ferrugineus]|uniref:Uncharacterized protein n=1 Tax=Rhynchophorus ferrugineus TaxID=354439 RepID=A0A834IKH8_RHYFE|nr:hypothetical protein GWI33_005452 [Rhynchophorus ferrugineus]